MAVARSRVLVDCRPQNPSIATPRSARCSGVMLSESGPRRCDCKKPLAPRSAVTLRIFSAKTGAYSTQCPSPSMTGCVSPLRISSGVWSALIWLLPAKTKCDRGGAYAPGTTQVKLRNVSGRARCGPRQARLDPSDAEVAVQDLGPGSDVVRGAFVRQVAIVEDVHPLGERHRRGKVLFDDDQRVALGGEAAAHVD